MNIRKYNIFRKLSYFDKISKRKGYLRYYIIGVLCLFLLYWLFVASIYKNKTDAGTFGDQFGGLNAIISGFAFVGIYISLHLQRKELRLQRHDLQLQREEMKKSREEAKKQTKQYEEQVQLGKNAQFADDFYRRISLLKTLEQDITYSNAKGAGATVRLASHINRIITLLLNSKLEEATDFFIQNHRRIFLAIDKFKVWGNSFLSLVSDIREQHTIQAFFKIKEIDENEGGDRILKIINKSARHYQTILIESTTWGEQYLLILIYNTIIKRKKDAIATLSKNRSFGHGSLTEHAKQAQYQSLFSKLYFINQEDDLASQVAMIFHDIHDNDGKVSENTHHQIQMESPVE